MKSKKQETPVKNRRLDRYAQVNQKCGAWFTHVICASSMSFPCWDSNLNCLILIQGGGHMSYVLWGVTCVNWPAPMAVWSKALLLTASCLSPLSGFEIVTGASEEVASALGLGSVFARYSGFLDQLHLACRDIAAIWQKNWRETYSNGLFFFSLSSTQILCKLSLKNHLRLRQSRSFQRIYVRSRRRFTKICGPTIAWRHSVLFIAS